MFRYTFYILFFGLYFCFPANALDADISGVEDTSLEDNIVAHLTTLSAPSTCSLTDNILTTIEEKIQLAAKAMGYYQVEINNIKLDDETGCDTVELSLIVGPQIIVNGVLILLQGEGEKDPEFEKIKQNFPIKVGSPLVHKNYSSGKNQFESLALSRGYFDAKYTKSALKVDVEKSQAAIELVYQTGPRYQFGELRMPEDLKARELIENVRTFKPSEPYSNAKLGKFNQNLKLTGYFQQVVARPILKDAQGLKIPIEVISTSRPRDIFNVGGGASTDTGPRVKLRWDRPWVNSDGHSMSADINLSVPIQSATFRYKIPIEDPLDNYFVLQAGYNGEDVNDTDNSQTLVVAAQRHWTNEDREWNKIAFIRYELSSFQQADDPRQTTGLLIPGFTLSRHRTRGGLDVFWGDLQRITIEGASKSIASDIDLARIIMQTKWLRSFGDHRFLMRAEFAALSSSDFDRVPSTLRYFAGGDQSIRGFGLKTLAPRETTSEGIDELVGGRYLNVGSIEYSYPVAENWRAAVFIDVGNASDDPFQDLAYGYGIGASYMSPVGPIRLYLARGESSVNDDLDDFRIHFSMGPAL